MNIDFTCAQITNRGSNARSLLKDSVRKLVPAQYRLKSGGKADMALSNAKRVKSLLHESAFHYKVANLADIVNRLTVFLSTDCKQLTSFLRELHYPHYYSQHVVLTWC